MVDRYFAQEHPKSKYYKNVPYISKKQFKKEECNYTIIGETSLKKYKSKYWTEKQYKVITYPKVDYLIKDKIHGFKKGYILLEDEECVVLKRHIPLFFFILLLLLILLLIFMNGTPKKDFPEDNIQENNNVIQEEIIPSPDTEKDEQYGEQNIQNNEKQPISKKEYKIIYHLNGGDFNSKYISSYIKGSTYNLPIPVKEGYQFDGWFLDSNLNNKNITKITASMSGDIELYAKWKPIQYTINYHLDSNEKSVISRTYDYDKEYALEKNTFEKTGFTFLNWYSKDNPDIIYEDQTKIKNLVSDNNQVIDLYANWKVNEYKITFKDFDDRIIDEYNLEYGSEIIYPSKPTRDGYNFKGWDNENKKVEDNLVITSKYEIIDYKIEYELNGGTLNNPIEKYNIKKESFQLPIPTKKGYTFFGWNNSEIAIPEIELVIEKGNFGDKKFTANWDANSYVIKLNPNGGILDQESVSIKFDNYYGNLPIPEKTGYEFEGWYYENNKISEDTIMQKDYDHELKAKWKVIDYKIEYELNGGTLNNPIEKYNIEMGNFNIEKPIKKGYIFTGWNINDSDELVLDLEITSETSGNLKLKANYSPICYQIIYDSNGGEGQMESTMVYYDQRINLNTNQYQFLGKKFIGWSIEKNGDLVYHDNQEILNLTIENNSKITLYAKWETIYYDVKFYDWNNEILKEDSLSYNSVVTPPTKMGRKGYTFISWDNPDYTIVGDTNYYPIYQKNTYTIQYDLNTGSSSDKQTIQYNVESDTFTLPIPERIGYTFEGWKDMESIEVNKEVTIHKDSIGDRSFKAMWKSNQYTVTFNPNGGQMINTVMKVNYNSLYGILPNISRVGYTFEGWYYQNELVTEDTVMQKNFNHELKAKWKVINYSISYQLNGGSVGGLITSYNIETNTFTLPIPTKKGYTFNGWVGTDLSSPNKNVSINQGSIGNRNYEANWSKNYYTVNYYISGNLWASRSVGYNDSLENLNGQSALDGYHTFHGWNGWVNSMPDHNVDLHANITEAYCNLITGHGPYGNASGLLNVFKSAGWTGNIIEASGFPGNYMVVTDYNLTRYQAEVQKNYIASHTNYTNYNFPYLYWVGVSCTNGYGESWTRSVGQSTFN